MSPLTRLLLSRLSKKSVYSAVYHAQAPSDLSLHMHFLDYSVHLCHRSCYSRGETVGRASWLVSTTGSMTGLHG